MTTQYSIKNLQLDLGVRFPSRFSQLIQEYFGKEIILRLPDEDYRILLSVSLQGNIKDSDEQSVHLSNEMDK